MVLQIPTLTAEEREQIRTRTLQLLQGRQVMPKKVEIHLVNPVVQTITHEHGYRCFTCPSLVPRGGEVIRVGGFMEESGTVTYVANFCQPGCLLLFAHHDTPKEREQRVMVVERELEIALTAVKRQFKPKLDEAANALIRFCVVCGTVIHRPGATWRGGKYRCPACLAAKQKLPLQRFCHKCRRMFDSDQPNVTTCPSCRIADSSSP